MEHQQRSFYRAVDQGFLSLAKRESRRIKLIPPHGSISDIAEKVWKEVKELLGQPPSRLHRRRRVKVLKK
jgi:thymidylate kinase